jgi:hypothetical protein
MQPAPGVPQQSQSSNAHVVPSSQLPHPAQHVAHPSQMSQPAHAAYPSHAQGTHQPANGQYYGAPVPQQQHLPQYHYIPFFSVLSSLPSFSSSSLSSSSLSSAPLPILKYIIFSANRYFPPPPPPVAPQQTAPTAIQPGQVYGHNSLRQTQSLTPSAPPITPSGYTPAPSNGYPTSSQAWYPPTSSHAYPPTSQSNPHLSHNNHLPPPPPPMSDHPQAHEYAHHPPAHESNPPPLPPKSNRAREYTSQHNNPAPYAPHQSLPASTTSQYPPAPTSTQPSGPAQSNSQYNHPPAPSTHGYPSPPSAVRSNYREPVPPATLYPSLPTAQSSAYSHAYPPAPSIAGSDAGNLRSEDMARLRIDDVAQNRRPPQSGVGSRASFFDDLANRQAPGDKPNYKLGEQQAKNVNRLSQYDMQYPIGENKSYADNTSLCQDFNHADAQSLKKSSETYNPWESKTLDATRQESLARGFAQDRSGIAKH